MADETTNVPGNAGAEFDISGAFFGTAAQAEGQQGEQSGDESQPDGAEATTVDASDDGAENAAATGAEQGEVTPRVWEFNGNQFTDEQVSAALKHQETYERFNTTITPLIDNIKQFGETAERMQSMATTETSRQIAELKARLQSGQLNAAEYQSTHQQLQAAELRMSYLTQAAEQEAAQRKQALNATRTHNARLVATNLVKAGWSKDGIAEAQQLAQQCLTPDQFADSLSVGFMEILRDAAELRRNKAAAAAALQAKGDKAVKVAAQSGKAQVKQVKQTKAGDADWMAKNFWGK